MTNHRFFHSINQQNNQQEYSQTKTNETGGMEEEIESGTDLDEFDDESSYERRQTVTMTRTIKAGSERLIKNSGNDLAKDPNDFAMIPETNRDRSRKNINYFSFIKKSALNKGSFEINGRHNEFVSCMDDVFYVKNLRFPDCVVRNLCQTYKYQGELWFRTPESTTSNSSSSTFTSTSASTTTATIGTTTAMTTSSNSGNGNIANASSSTSISSSSSNLNHHSTPQDGQYYDSVYEKIHVELNNFYSFIKPLKEDEIIRKATFYCIADSIKKLKFVKQVKYYGSYSSKTYLPVSDIDLVCYCNPIFDEISLLFNIAKQLSYDGIIESKFNIVPMSKIPLLKFHDSLTCLPINITINTPNVMERSQYLREHIKTNSNQMKILLFLKYYLLSKGTNQVFYGGIGSYSLALMVIRFFQEESVKELIKNENVFQNSILGYLLMGFLERFGDVNFFKHHIISVQDNGDYIRCSYQDYNRHSNPDKKTSVLRIKDHIEPWNDVSYGSFNSGEILKDFQFLHDKFMKGDKSKTKSLLGQVLYVVDSFVEYRNLLLFLFRKWFDDYDVKEYMAGKYPTKLKFQEFIEKRKIFRKINIGFSNYYLEDKSIEFRIEPLRMQSNHHNYHNHHNNYNHNHHYHHNHNSYHSNSFHFPSNQSHFNRQKFQQRSMAPFFDGSDVQSTIIK